MKVVICHNCGGFGVTVGPVLRPVDDHGDTPASEDSVPESVSREDSVVYRCQACEGEGFLTVVVG